MPLVIHYQIVRPAETAVAKGSGHCARDLLMPSDPNHITNDKAPRVVTEFF